MHQPTRRKVPIRTCISCRKPSIKGDLTRVVRGPDGVVRVDATGKAPGRGAYLCGRKECLARVAKDNKLGRALKCAVGPEILAQLERFVVRDDAQD